MQSWTELKQAKRDNFKFYNSSSRFGVTASEFNVFFFVSPDDLSLCLLGKHMNTLAE